MCEINPAKASLFLLEFFTSDRRVTAEDWDQMVRERVLELEQKFNESGEIRVHVHEIEKVDA
jgi:hypothetical protein